MKYATHYDAIPSHFLKGAILDVGCGDMSNQKNSKNWPYLVLGDYTGIDIEEDIFNYETDQTFDTVLAIHVIEHIELIKWPAMFERLCSWVTPGGHLIIGTPYMQSPSVYRNFKGPENQRHRVFRIDEKAIEYYLGEVGVIRYRGPYSQSLMCIWRKEE
jgi:2-polyprenyl-3-methyl-5-hydroxy-6-metoxy-1,4-benzoquinol methylase